MLLFTTEKDAIVTHNSIWSKDECLHRKSKIRYKNKMSYTKENGKQYIISYMFIQKTI